MTLNNINFEELKVLEVKYINKDDTFKESFYFNGESFEHYLTNYFSDDDYVIDLIDIVNIDSIKIFVESLIKFDLAIVSVKTIY